jgi:hypothetical protein
MKRSFGVPQNMGLFNDSGNYGLHAAGDNKKVRV